jgi:drug/metabolite transporter (DMT)-like permease
LAGVPRSRIYTLQLLFAFFANYVLYGANYLGISESVNNGIPTVTSGGFRYVLAGVVVLIVLGVRRRSLRLTRANLLATMFSSVLVLGVFGLVAVAETHISSGLAALLLASVPLIVVALRITVDRERVSTPVIVSVFIGFAGVAIVVISRDASTSASLEGLALVILAALGLGGGTFLMPRLPLPEDTMLSAGWQLIWGGLLLMVIGALLGEWSHVHLGAVPAKAWIWYFYLVTLGTFACFLCFVWLLGQVPVSQVAAAGYVNPIVAVILGWAVAGEQLGVPALVGGGLIIISVAFLIAHDHRRVIEVAPPGLGPAAEPVEDAGDGSPVLAPPSGHQVVEGQGID